MEDTMRECARKESEQEAMLKWLYKPVREWTDEQKIEFMNCMDEKATILEILRIVQDIRDDTIDGDLR